MSRVSFQDGRACVMLGCRGAALSLQMERPPVLGAPKAPPALTDRLAPGFSSWCLPWC